MKLRYKLKREVAGEYGISLQTLRKWCRRHGIAWPTEGHFLSPSKQREIYTKLEPPEIEIS